MGSADGRGAESQRDGGPATAATSLALLALRGVLGARTIRRTVTDGSVWGRIQLYSRCIAMLSVPRCVCRAKFDSSHWCNCKTR